MGEGEGGRAARLSHTTDFIAELYRAANEIGKLTPFEKRRLIERAVITVRDMREQAAASDPDRTGGDVLDGIEAIALDIASVPDALVGHAMLEAADMIRALKILLDARSDI